MLTSWLPVGMLTSWLRAEPWIFLWVGTMTMEKCSACNNDFQMPAERCPHCAQSGLFSNVYEATRQARVDALEQRFQLAYQDVTLRRCEVITRDFIADLAGSQAVIARHIGDVERLARSDKEGYATYYQLVASQVRLPDGDEWDVLRHVTDEALFPGYKEHIRFAALTLDGLGVLNYGAWSLVLRTPMIAHRASIFEENTAVFMKRREVPIPKVAQHITGYVASWAERGKLAVAKLAAEITAATTKEDFARLLLRQGSKGATVEDHFVEVHIWGPMTIRTVERVLLSKGREERRNKSKARLAAIEEYAKKQGASMEVRP